MLWHKIIEPMTASQRWTLTPQAGGGNQAIHFPALPGNAQVGTVTLTSTDSSGNGDGTLFVVIADGVTVLASTCVANTTLVVTIPANTSLIEVDTTIHCGGGPVGTPTWTVNGSSGVPWTLTPQGGSSPTTVNFPANTQPSKAGTVTVGSTDGSGHGDGFIFTIKADGVSIFGPTIVSGGTVPQSIAYGVSLIQVIVAASGGSGTPVWTITGAST